VFLRLRALDASYSAKAGFKATVAVAVAVAAAAATLAAPALASASSGGTPATIPSAHHHAKPPQKSAGSQTRVPSRTGASVAGQAKAARAPITARQPGPEYQGPVYEQMAGGQVVPYEQAPASGSTLEQAAGDAALTAPEPRPRLLVPGRIAQLVEGLAAAPMEAPAAVQKIIWAGDELIGLPYIYGGGHGSWRSPGYDCSGSVSYALHGASLLSAPEDSSEFESFGGRGAGEWVTVFANPEHAYMDVAGVRLDTSPANDPSGLLGPRWRPLRPQNEGFVLRHPLGL
jgi:cell wall-associated NlpC family hydrolase